MYEILWHKAERHHVSSFFFYFISQIPSKISEIFCLRLKGAVDSKLLRKKQPNYSNHFSENGFEWKKLVLTEQNIVILQITAYLFYIKFSKWWTYFNIAFIYFVNSLIPKLQILAIINLFDVLHIMHCEMSQKNGHTLNNAKFIMKIHL